MEPLVSICCVTYHHGPYLAQALDSFLSQRADVSIEILAHDDASPDETPAILRAYAERYPDVVFPLYETENQYQKGVAMDATFNFPRARGRFIALCEGDDYWSDPHKLKLQTDYLLAHPECTFCFTNATIHDESGQSADRPFLPFYPSDAALLPPEGRTYALDELVPLSFLPTASFVFPREALERIPRAYLTRPCPHGDLRLKLLLTGLGRAAYLPRQTCVYRLNRAGSAMTAWGAEPPQRTLSRCQSTLDVLADVDELTKQRYTDTLQALGDEYRRVMLLAAPTREMARRPEFRRAAAGLSASQRLKSLLKRALPVGWWSACKRWLGRS